ncbi:hypothetical protein QO004_000731 [Rhizobium mesoamericanum]|uniref:hypothetical protein n=1 Tax=Rhizobium mesoamericanum TaxID=1079800 RepID=UPI00278A218D|nr:hypothetical protein [Rhizobium mesoamericanum]MDQ0558956.1 hypothetical protein [Rhizobium mesoamericanum]
MKVARPFSLEAGTSATLRELPLAKVNEPGLMDKGQIAILVGVARLNVSRPGESRARSPLVAVRRKTIITLNATMRNYRATAIDAWPLLFVDRDGPVMALRRDTLLGAWHCRRR